MVGVAGSNPVFRFCCPLDNVIEYLYFAPIAQLDRVSDYESEGCRFDSYWVHFLFFREVAQLGRAPGLGPGGRRFESCLPDFFVSKFENNMICGIFEIVPSGSSSAW